MMAAFRAEWAKLLRPGIVLGGGGIIVAVGLLTVAVVFGSAEEEERRPSIDPNDPNLPSKAMLERPEGLAFAFGWAGTLIGIIVLVLFAQSIGSEYGYGTLKVMLTREPRRLVLLSSKFAAIAVFATIAIFVAFWTQTAFAVTIASSRGIETSEWWTSKGWADAAEVTFRILGSALGFGVIGGFMGVLFRAAAPAIGIGIGYTLFAETIVTYAWREGRKWLPGQVLQAVSLGGTPQASLEHASWMSLLYVVIIAAAASVLFVRRDVTS